MLARFFILPVVALTLGSSLHAAKVPNMRSFGAPTISAEANWSDTLDFEDGTGGLDLSGLRLDAPFWKVRTGDSVVGLELRYDWTRFELLGVPALNEVDLHSIDLSVKWAHFPKESGWIGMLNVTGGVGSDFGDFNGDAWQFSALGFWGYQMNPKFSWAIAGYASYSLGDVMAYPSIGIVWSPSEEWRIQLTPPLAVVSWKPNNDWRVALTFLPNGGSWQIESRDGVEQIDLSLWTASLMIERRLMENLYVSVRGGIHLGGDLELRDGSERVEFASDLDAGAFAAVGLSWKF